MRQQPNSQPVDNNEVRAALVELIDALERRVPHIERIGEIHIAAEAAALKKTAVSRLETMAAATSTADELDGERRQAVMSDDGGPAREPG